MALLLGAIPVSAQTIVGLDPSSTGSISISNNGTGSLDLVLPSVLSGTGYEFDSVGGDTLFNIGSTLSTFSSSDQDTMLSLGGGTPMAVTWVDLGGGGLPGILVLQFTTPAQYPGTYDDLILNLTSISYPYFADAEPCTLTSGCGSVAIPTPAGFNACNPSTSSACSYDGLVNGGGTIVIYYYACGMFDLGSCVGETAPDPITAAADISSGEVFLGAPVPTPEPSSLSLFAIGLIAIFGSGVIRRKVFRA